MQEIPDAIPAGDAEGDLLIVAWGSTHGAITAALKAQREQGRKIGHIHLRYLNPLPANLGEVLQRYKTVLVPELNMGQLLWVLRAKYLVDASGLNRCHGRPFKQAERLSKTIEEILGRELLMSTATLPPIHASHQERFSDGPGNSLVPRLRRLRHSFRRSICFSRPRHQA